MWKCGELNGSGKSPALWPVTYGPAHDRQGTACFICGQRGLFTSLFQFFFLPALSCRSQSLFSPWIPPWLSPGPLQLFLLLQCRGLLTVCSQRVWAERCPAVPLPTALWVHQPLVKYQILPYLKIDNNNLFMLDPYLDTFHIKGKVHPDMKIIS